MTVFPSYYTLLAVGLLFLHDAVRGTDEDIAIEFKPLFAHVDDIEPPTKDWWQTASFYQIYPRSFKDSNGDGIGDLNGITDNLLYLAALGISATWLSPIFKSPMVDFGYDISNFFEIEPQYGTLADFDRMVATAHELGIKIILDFVPNHTSDENEWFKLSAQRDEHYADFYVWHPGFVDPKNASHRLPPNNWVSAFGKSAWQFNEQRQEFYMHEFAVKQPDLNYRNPKVVETMKSVLRYWLKRGVAGFRFDAVSYVFEVPADEYGNYPDEPLSGNTNDTNSYGYLNHIYTIDRPESVDMVYQWRATLDEFQKENGGDTRVMLVECGSEIVVQYFGNATHEGAQIPFNTLFIQYISNASTAFDYKKMIDVWMARMPTGRTANWVLGNHDRHRVASRLGTDRIDIMNMILLTLPGASITYNGEEIGMVDVWLSWKDTLDPAACNTNPQVYEYYTRDPGRTPFQWDNTTSAGFSSNPHTWLPVATNYKELNVANQIEANYSHLTCYGLLILLRQTTTMQYGDLVVHAANNNVLIIERRLSGHVTYITFLNIGSGTEYVNYGKMSIVPSDLIYVIVGGSSKHRKGETVQSDHIVLQPKESFVLQTKTAQFHQDKQYFSYQSIV